MSSSTVGNYPLNNRSAWHSYKPGMRPHTLTSCTLKPRWDNYIPSKPVSKNRTTTTNIQKESPSNLKLRRGKYFFGGDYTLGVSSEIQLWSV